LIAPLAILLLAQTLSIEAGIATGEVPALGVTVGGLAGPVGAHYEFGFDFVGDSHDYESTPNAIGPRAMLVKGWKQFDAGLGFQWWNVESRESCQFTFALLARWRFTERWAAQWRHASSANSCRPNQGRDVVGISLRF
jgi:hypothetical protein